MNLLSGIRFHVDFGDGFVTRILFGIIRIYIIIRPFGLWEAILIHFV